MLPANAIPPAPAAARLTKSRRDHPRGATPDDDLFVFRFFDGIFVPPELGFDYLVCCDLAILSAKIGSTIAIDAALILVQRGKWSFPFLASPAQSFGKADRIFAGPCLC
jgi:hypothetical protein